MTTLREAAQQALDALIWEVGSEPTLYAAQTAKAIKAIRAALEQPEQEPYWYVDKEGKHYSSNEVKRFIDPKTKALYKDPPQWLLDIRSLIPLYTNPPRREWRGLSEEDIKSCERATNVNGALPHERRDLFARAVEAALKERNA